jgi:hypothetical protein
MLNNVALDVFIGLVFVFLLYSLLTTIIQEIIATRFAFRAKVLEKAIIRMLEEGALSNKISYVDRLSGILHLFNLKSFLKGKQIAPWFYAHPLIKYLAEDNWYSKPAYISPANFSKVILDLLKGKDYAPAQALQVINDSIVNGIFHKITIDKTDTSNPAIRHLLKNESTAQSQDGDVLHLNESTAYFLQSLWNESGADVEVFKTKLEQWFNDTMERAAGWFKKYTRIVSFVIGLIVAIAFNVDSLAIRKILTTNRTAREQMVQMAIESQSHSDPDKISNGDSSLLDSTYKLVAADAGKANDVLGLGRSWNDTANMYKDSLKCANFQSRLARLEQEAGGTESAMKKLNENIARSKQKLNLLIESKDTSQRVLDLIAGMQDTIRAEQQELGLLSTQRLELQRMKFFKERSEYIIAQQKNKYFLYSPNQAGGLETFFGWVLTALAVMLGAPFWFDLLSKLISLRGTGTKISTGDLGQPAPAAGINTTSSATTSTATSSNTNTDQEAVG